MDSNNDELQNSESSYSEFKTSSYNEFKTIKYGKMLASLINEFRKGSKLNNIRL